MPIDIRTETLMTVPEAARFLTERFRRGRRKVSPGTVRRWMASGHQGVRLEWSRTPDARFTSVEAIDRFCAALASLDAGEPVLSCSAAAREEEAKARLRARGFEV